MIRSTSFGTGYPMPLKQQTEISQGLQDTMNLRQVKELKKTLPPEEFEIIEQHIKNLKQKHLPRFIKAQSSIQTGQTPEQLAEIKATNVVLNTLAMARSERSRKLLLTIFKEMNENEINKK